MRSDRTGHLIAVQSFRNRLGILEVSVHAFRDLMRTKRPSRPLAGVLVERIALAATDLTKLVPRLAARLMASAGPNGGRVLRERVDETVPVALDNPYDPVLTPEGMRRRQDLLLDERIPQAAPDALVKLMGELRLDTGALITDEDAPPSFLGALTRNRHFRTAAEGLGAMLSQASRN